MYEYVGELLHGQNIHCTITSNQASNSKKEFTRHTKWVWWAGEAQTCYFITDDKNTDFVKMIIYKNQGNSIYFINLFS
jgi:hypothetical protein